MHCDAGMQRPRLRLALLAAVLTLSACAATQTGVAIVARLADAGIPIDDVAFTHALPTDTRHRAKLDYRAIRQEYSS